MRERGQATVTTSKATTAVASLSEVVGLESNLHLVSSGLSCEEEEGEWRHDGGQSCMPLVVASWTCDERWQLGVTRPSNSNS